MITVLLYSNYLKIQIYNTETKVTLVVQFLHTHAHTHLVTDLGSAGDWALEFVSITKSQFAY